MDAANGNTYVTMAEGQEKTIYWAAPEGLAKDGRVEVYRFDALNRSRDLLVEMILKENPPQKIEAERVEIQGRTYFKFSTAEFATFVLRYEEAEPQPDLLQLTVVSGSGADAMPPEPRCQSQQTRHPGAKSSTGGAPGMAEPSAMNRWLPPPSGCPAMM